MTVSGIDGSEWAGEQGFGPEAMETVLAKVQEGGHKFEKVSLDPGELERWEETAGKPLWDKWVADMDSKGLAGQKVLDEYRRLLEKYRVE